MRKVAKAIKGTSAHSINRKLHSHEAVWQEESFDHVLRSSESLDAKIDYVLQNPVRKGLVRIASEYPWSWRKPMDHQDRSRRGGCPHPPSDAEHRKTLAIFREGAMGHQHRTLSFHMGPPPPNRISAETFFLDLMKNAPAPQKG